MESDSRAAISCERETKFCAVSDGGAEGDGLAISSEQEGVMGADIVVPLFMYGPWIFVRLRAVLRPSRRGLKMVLTSHIC